MSASDQQYSACQPKPPGRRVSAVYVCVCVCIYRCVSLGLATTTVGFVLATFTMGSYWAIVGLSIAAIGMYGKMGAFWALCGGILKKNKAAVGFAFINSVGNL